VLSGAPRKNGENRGLRRERIPFLAEHFSGELCRIADRIAHAELPRE